MSNGKKSNGYDGLLERYLDICNQVMRKNRDRFPYNQIWQAGEEALSGRSVQFTIVDDAPKAQCRVTLESNEINGEIGQDTKDEPPVMRLSTTYIEDVVANPKKYIENPSLIDWDWLQMRK